MATRRRAALARLLPPRFNLKRLVLSQRPKLLTHWGFLFTANFDSRLAKELCHTFCHGSSRRLRRFSTSRVRQRLQRSSTGSTLAGLAGVYDGMSREAAARVGGMDRQTLRDWVHRFNKDGADGLRHGKGAGRQRLLSNDQLSTFAKIVETGPDPETDGVVRWRRIDLQRVLEKRFNVTVSDRYPDCVRNWDFPTSAAAPNILNRMRK